ncbi:protein of unknown function DUF541 [Pseudoxanthomonas suwonensis 11-1]|uniref:SIMPL domain-containing protein n=1 Tax=Pseudoxanthomonas suwonensis (strain 11-1) TaxID=743721 RepID=E6WWC4_PSEUU|nr:SIMPL domain-containing protein [Pseudoxanthomonas suwonensis]ADV28332.1 protein of unknown function DUF541 [Pseudoxanthomonas suwonensis 11-1]
MKGIIAALLLSFLALGAQAQSISGAPFIAVHGKAKAEVVPDIFPLHITLSETSKDAARTQRQIESLAQRVLELAQGLGLEGRDIDISNLDVEPEYRYNDRDDTQVFLGNTYERRIKLRFRRLADLQAMISSLPAAPQLQLSTGGFQLSRADELRKELLAAAVEDARGTAEAMAASVGRRLGTVHNISNQGFNVRYATSGGGVELDSIAVTGSRAAAAPAVLKEGSIELAQDVYIIYTLVE